MPDEEQLKRMNRQMRQVAAGLRDPGEQTEVCREILTAQREIIALLAGIREDLTKLASQLERPETQG
jgi:hypothetical protein